MLTLIILLLVVASGFTAKRAARPGADARLRWLSIALGVAALALALWTVRKMVIDHRRADTPPAGTSSIPSRMAGATA